MQNTVEIPQVHVDVAVIMQRQVPAVPRGSWRVLRTAHRQAHDVLRWVLQYFTAFFGLRPLGRQVSMCFALFWEPIDGQQLLVIEGSMPIHLSVLST